MKYNIYLDGTLINTIVSDEEFCKQYCTQHSYTYQLINEPVMNNPEPENEISEIEQLRADIDYLSVMTGVDL